MLIVEKLSSIHIVSLAVFCQVTMSDRIGADRACKEPNPIIDGRKANVNLAYLGAKPRVNGNIEKILYALVVWLLHVNLLLC